MLKNSTHNKSVSLWKMRQIEPEQGYKRNNGQNHFLNYGGTYFTGIKNSVEA